MKDRNRNHRSSNGSQFIAGFELIQVQNDLTLMVAPRASCGPDGDSDLHNSIRSERAKPAHRNLSGVCRACAPRLTLHNLISNP